MTISELVRKFLPLDRRRPVDVFRDADIGAYLLPMEFNQYFYMFSTKFSVPTTGHHTEVVKSSQHQIFSSATLSDGGPILVYSFAYSMHILFCYNCVLFGPIHTCPHLHICTPNLPIPPLDPVGFSP